MGHSRHQLVGESSEMVNDSKEQDVVWVCESGNGLVVLPDGLLEDFVLELEFRPIEGHHLFSHPGVLNRQTRSSAKHRGRTNLYTESVESLGAKILPKAHYT